MDIGSVRRTELASAYGATNRTAVRLVRRQLHCRTHVSPWDGHSPFSPGDPAHLCCDTGSVALSARPVPCSVHHPLSVLSGAGLGCPHHGRVHARLPRLVAGMASERIRSAYANQASTTVLPGLAVPVSIAAGNCPAERAGCLDIRSFAVFDSAPCPALRFSPTESQ
jgi:hypothetical protein